jgi:YHS domain-containing protein
MDPGLLVKPLPNDSRVFGLKSISRGLGARNMQKDPVCGMMVDEMKSKLKSEHDGRTFYFCSAGCKASFDKDPHRYGHSA